jgi:hypothetical protein
MAFGVRLRANPMGMAFPPVSCRGRIKPADNAETYEPKVQTKIIADANMAGLCNRLLKARKFSTVLSEMHLRHCELLQSTVNCSVDLYFRAGLCPRIVLFNKADSLTPFEKIRTREIRTSESFWQRMMLDNKPPGAVTLVFLLPLNVDSNFSNDYALLFAVTPTCIGPKIVLLDKACSLWRILWESKNCCAHPSWRYSWV